MTQKANRVNNPESRQAVQKSRLTVTEAARRLGVTRVHLSYVLNGHRQSRRLLRRYQELQQAA